jgi:lipoprotein-anchoring transpeptidase ErfK/SrfK
MGGNVMFGTGIYKLAVKTLGAAVVAIGLMAPLGAEAQASVVAKIDISSQQMNVIVNGRHYASWKVSTGRRGYRTPTGSYRPKWLARMHYSRKYNNSPMPHSIFFRGGYAIHGTNYIRNLGRPASHGCVRLHPRNAKTLFSLVRQYGMKNTRIKISY